MTSRDLRGGHYFLCPGAPLGGGGQTREDSGQIRTWKLDVVPDLSRLPQDHLMKFVCVCQFSPLMHTHTHCVTPGGQPSDS